jgi:hypothetical protein
MQDTNKPDLPTRIPPQESIRPRLDPAALERLLEGWMQGDPREQRETFEVLRRSLDEDRPAGYKLFS